MSGPRFEQTIMEFQVSVSFGFAGLGGGGGGEMGLVGLTWELG